MASLNQIFSWFKTGLKPTEQQFKETFSSFWHKSEKIPAAAIEGNAGGGSGADAFPPGKKSLIQVGLMPS